MSGIRRFLLAVVFLSQAYPVPAQNLTFYREDLTFRIEGVYFYVNGVYYLSSSEPPVSPVTLLYPFPTDSIYSTADSLFIYNLTRNEGIIDYIKKKDMVVFQVGLDTLTAILISYRQKYHTGEVRYILTTTQNWGKPLEQANFKLILDKNINIVYFSYPPDRFSIFGNTKIYYWEKKNFMPLEDMIFILN